MCRFSSRVAPGSIGPRPRRAGAGTGWCPPTGTCERAKWPHCLFCWLRLRVVTFPYSCDLLPHLPVQSIIDPGCADLGIGVSTPYS